MIGGYDEEVLPPGSWMDSAAPGSYFEENGMLYADLRDMYGNYVQAFRF